MSSSVLTLVLEIFILTGLPSGQSTVYPDDVIVRLQNGDRIRGSILNSEKGEPFYAFMGIPYAEPPVGELRFKAPVPIVPWQNESIFDATEDGNVCYQNDMMLMRGFVGDEDCLNLNVYTPQLPLNDTEEDKKSVMIFIYGGGFGQGDGSSETYPPERMMDSDIVLVTFNYRLGALGFFSTGDSSAPGNYGLLDQTLVLQWVKDNIESFGGNANSVTIFGESAGAVSVSFHLISPLSKGLFHRSIAMSGSDLQYYVPEPNPLVSANNLASQLNCTLTPTSAMVQCLRTKPVKALVTNVPFAPTVDGHFLRAHPRQILTYFPEQISRVPIMNGHTEMEGSSMISSIKELQGNDSEVSDKVFEQLFSFLVQDTDIIHMIRDKYLKNVDRTNEYETNKAIIQANSDGGGVMNIYEELQLLSKAGLDVFTYSYDYSTKHTVRDYPMLDRTYGVKHTEDLYILFNLTWYGGIPYVEEDLKMVDIMTQLWSNFAKTGNPDPAHKYLPEWKTCTPETLYIHHLNLSITVEDYSLIDNEFFDFWTKDVPAAKNKTQQQSI